jgi:subtilisin-like proprotein convertase family protein
MKNIFSFLALACAFAASAQTYTANPNSPINDYATTEYNLTVSGLNPANIDTTTFGLETVCVNLTHTWNADIDMYIVAPDGTTSMLVSGQGGSDDNYTNTCFNTSASQPITAGWSPFTGTFRPMGQMGRVNNGQNANGVWKLRITDTYPADAGTMISWSITFGNNPASYFSLLESDLPIFVINTNNQAIPDEPRIMADMGIIWNGNGNRNYMTNPFNHYNGKVGIETRGASSSTFPKKSYDLELWDVNGNDINMPLLGFPTESDWVLSAQYTDKTLMRGMLTFHLYNEMGWYAPRCRPVEIVINGEYLGVYILMEKVKSDANRIDIPTLQPTDISGDQLTGGYILKLDKNSGSSDPGWNSPYLPWPTGDSIYINYYYPDGDDIVPQQAAYIQAYVDSFETALIGPNFMHPTLGYRAYADINACVDAFIIQELTKSIDAYRKSFYIYKDKFSNGGKLVMAPIWDYDLTYGNVNFCEGEDYAGWQYNFNYICGGDYWLNPFWFERMTQDSVFMQQVRCRWEELRGSILNSNYINTWTDSTANAINESQGWNFTVWPIMGAYVWPNYYVGQNYQEEVDTLQWWINQRILWLDNNLGGNPNNCNLTGISEQQNFNGSIYPNPAQQQTQVSLYLKNAGIVQIELYNSTGQKCSEEITFSGVIGNNLITVPLDNLPLGVYFIRITAGKNRWTQRIVVTKP